MNISENYSKQQLDRSAYISKDKYKKAFDLNRIRLAVYKITGSSSRFSYYYTEYLFFYLLERLHSLGITTTFNKELFEYIDSMQVISKDDDEEQLETAERDWGAETIERIIDEVTGDDDLGDYNDPTEEEIKQAAEQAASDDSDSGEPFRFPWIINTPGAPTPPNVVTETVKETLEEVAKDPETDKGNVVYDGTMGIGTIATPGEGPGTRVTVYDDGRVVITDPKTGETVEGTVKTTDEIGTGSTIIGVTDASDGREDFTIMLTPGPTDIGDEPFRVGDDYDACGGDSTGSDTPSCGDCDDLGCGDCDTCAGGDCCVSDIPCADTPPCDSTCGGGDYEPPPCDTCSGDSGGCPADCCVSDCCISDGGCASGDSCGNCDCCVNDSACTNVSCGGDMSCGSDCNCDCASDCGSNCDGSSCDCGNDCDNYGDCIDSCGGNE